MSAPARQWRPSELATPEKVRALLAAGGLDDLTRAALEQRLASQEQLAAGVDPFRGVRMGAEDDGWWSA